jgi:hypothetical protein
MGHVRDLRYLKCIFMHSDDTSTTGNPWQECIASNCEKQQNFASKTWLNLELGTGPMGHLGTLVPPKCMPMLGYHISTTGNPWQECAVLNCENQQNIASKIWFNLEPGSGATDHQGNPVPPKFTFIIGNHICTTGNPWREYAALNCENQPNFGPKISFNLKPGSGTIDHQGNPVPPKFTFIIGNHICTTGNPWQKYAAFDCENQQNFTPKIWFNLEPGSGAIGHVGNLGPQKCMFMTGYHISISGNPWRECTALNCENQQNFASKIWFNLEPDSSAMGQLGNLMTPKSIFKLGDPICTTENENPWRECAKISRILLQKFGTKLGTMGHWGSVVPLKCMLRKFGSIWNWVRAPWITGEIWCL